MAWVSQGTVSVTNGSPTVVGAGTNWFGALQNGWGFVGPDGRTYEVLTVNSATSLTLRTDYQGATAAEQIYGIFPTSSLDSDLAASLQTLVGNYAGVYSTVGQGRFSGDVVFESDRDTGLTNPASNEVGLKAGGDLQLGLAGGVARGAAVMSSLWDDTAGKLLKNGGHGLGGTAKILGTGDDYDGVPVTQFVGTFSTGAAPANAPFSSSLFAGVTVRNSPSQFMQILAPLTGGRGLQWRGRNNGFGDWREVFDQKNILGTVSGSFAENLGALIQYGNLPNGEFWRFAGGLQVCKRSVGLGARSSTSGSGGLYRSDTFPFGLPSGFASGSFVAASISGDLFPSGLLYAVSCNTSQWSVRVGAVSSFSSVDCGDVVLTAIGPWAS